MAMTALSTITPEQIASLEEVVKETGLMAISGAGVMERAFKLAAGIRELRARITPEMMKDIIALQDTALGFRTDRDPNVPKFNRDSGKWERQEPYPPAVVKECLIEALLRGAYPVNNELNIISGRAYLTVAFFERVVGQIPGVTDVKVSPGIPRMVGDSGSVVRVHVQWKKDGKSDCLVDDKNQPGREFAIRVNKGMGADAILGKAKRKALKAAHEQITGSTSLPDGDIGDDGGFIEGELKAGGDAGHKSELNDRLRAAAGTNASNGGGNGKHVATPTDADKAIEEAAAKAQKTAASHQPPKGEAATPAGSAEPEVPDVVDEHGPDSSDAGDAGAQGVEPTITSGDTATSSAGGGASTKTDQTEHVDEPIDYADWDKFQAAVEKIAERVGMQPEEYDKFLFTKLLAAGKARKGHLTEVGWRQRFEKAVRDWKRAG